jgi:polar amino acid transport system substrate-binding protein
MTTTLCLSFDPEFAPLTYVDAGGPVGRAIDVVRSACERAGINVEFVPVGLGASRDVAELRLDGFACMAVTPERTGLTFSVPYLTTTAAFFVAEPPNAQAPVPVARALTVITPRNGPLFQPLSAAASAQCPAVDQGPATVARVVPGTDYQDCLRRVLAGEVDAAALNAEVGATLIARLHPGAFIELPAPLPALGLAVALTGEPRDAELLLSRLDPALEAAVRECPYAVRTPGGRA